MASLILNAGTSSPITVTCQRLGKGTNRYVGKDTESANGNLRSSKRGQARTIPVLTSYLTTAEEAAIQAAIYNGVQIPCSGDILGNIQTLCSIECVSSDLVPGLVGFYVMQLAISEVNASTVLLKYAPGDTITGETFTRSTTGTYINSVGNIATAAINAKRDSHYLNSNRTLLLEGGRTNSFTRSEEIDNAAWTKTRSTVTANATTAPDGAATADKLVEDVSVTTDHYLQRNLPAMSDNTSQSLSLLAKAAGRTWVRVRTVNKTGTVANTFVNLTTGAIGTTDANHVNKRITALNNAWFRIELTFGSGAGATTPSTEITLATGDGVVAYTGDGAQGAYIWGLQIEIDSPCCSSYIPTVGATVARTADSYQAPFAIPPQEMTLYVKLYEGGTSVTAGARVLEISSAADASPRFFAYAPSGFYAAFHGNAVTVASALSTAPSMGDVVELAARLFDDGSVDIAQSINSGAQSSSTQSASTPRATAWSGQLAWFNSAGTTGSNGFEAIQSMKLVAGTRSLAEMRAA